MKKYRITYEKQKFLSYEIDSLSMEEAIEIANNLDEKIGFVFETPYILARSKLISSSQDASEERQES